MLSDFGVRTVVGWYPYRAHIVISSYQGWKGGSSFAGQWQHGFFGGRMPQAARVAHPGLQSCRALRHLGDPGIQWQWKNAHLLYIHFYLVWENHP